jgi:hypothetical protein
VSPNQYHHVKQDQKQGRHDLILGPVRRVLNPTNTTPKRHTARNGLSGVPITLKTNTLTPPQMHRHDDVDEGFVPNRFHDAGIRGGIQFERDLRRIQR